MKIKHKPAPPLQWVLFLCCMEPVGCDSKKTTFFVKTWKNRRTGEMLIRLVFKGKMSQSIKCRPVKRLLIT